MSIDTEAPKSCPKCGGTSGHEHVLTQQHLMGGDWGEAAIAGDSGPTERLKVWRSLVRCLDCDAKFSHAALAAKGFV